MCLNPAPAALKPLVAHVLIHRPSLEFVQQRLDLSLREFVVASHPAAGDFALLAPAPQHVGADVQDLRRFRQLQKRLAAGRWWNPQLPHIADHPFGDAIAPAQPPRSDQSRAAQILREICEDSSLSSKERIDVNARTQSRKKLNRTKAL